VDHARHEEADPREPVGVLRRGLERPDEGEVLADGDDVVHLARGPDDRRRVERHPGLPSARPGEPRLVARQRLAGEAAREDPLEAGQRIQRLTRDLVAYARPVGARTEPVDLADVVDEAVRLAKPALKDRAAIVEKKLQPAPPVEASRASLVQVVVNLVKNAAQAVTGGGHVTVSVAPDGAQVRLTVADDGPGMAPELAARAFEPFFTTRPGQGVGLGLPIVQGIVERHGGTVALDTAPGAGTRVTVTLPVARPR
jgi:signal transduction histidine kinase